MMEILCDGFVCNILDDSNKLFASVSYNPSFLWVKFTLLDDKVNANDWVVPREEFDNVIKTGKYMPIKAAFNGNDIENHLGAIPVGVVTHLMVEDNKIKAIGAIWKEEFPEIAEFIKQKVSSGEKVGVSWELYNKIDERQEDGTVVLRGILMTGVAIVKNPAYGDRTPIEDVGEIKLSEKWSKSYINSLPDCAFLYIEPGGEKDEEGKTTPRSLRHLPVKNHNCEIDRPHLINAIQRLSQSSTGEVGGKKWLTESLREKLLQKARQMLEELNKKESDDMSELEKRLAELEQELSEKDSQIEALKAQLKTMEEINKELSEFKNKVMAEMERQKRLAEIKQKFSEAGIEKDEEYFEKNAEKLLKMDDEALDFLIQEMVAFKKEASAINYTEDGEPQPNFIGTNDLVAAVKALMKELK